jgi:TolB-like protein
LTLSTSCTGKAVLALLGGLMFLSGCAASARRAAGSPPFSVPPETRSPGSRAEGGESIQSPISSRYLYTVPIAVLPVENLSGTTVPLNAIRESLIESLKTRGFHLVGESILEEFMARHHVRYTGGIDGTTARAFKDETGAGAVLVTSVELYDDRSPPKISMFSRLVSTDPVPVILWMNSVGMSGDDSPGILDLGWIGDSRVLLEKALRFLSDDMAESVSGGNAGEFAERKRSKFRPTVSYRSPAMVSDAPQTLAVLPFFNQSRRKYAGEIMKLHMVKEMTRIGNFKVIEPGVVRKELLNYRIIMEDGISLSQTDVLGGILDADLLLTGKVLDYQDYQGTEGAPVVDFSLMLIERKRREVVWASKSVNKGTDGVYFFDWGRERTASTMASEMGRIVGEMIWK